MRVGSCIFVLAWQTGWLAGLFPSFLFLRSIFPCLAESLACWDRIPPIICLTTKSICILIMENNTQGFIGEPNHAAGNTIYRYLKSKRAIMVRRISLLVHTMSSRFTFTRGFYVLLSLSPFWPSILRSGPQRGNKSPSIKGDEFRNEPRNLCFQPSRFTKLILVH